MGAQSQQESILSGTWIGPCSPRFSWTLGGGVGGAGGDGRLVRVLVCWCLSVGVCFAICWWPRSFVLVDLVFTLPLKLETTCRAATSLTIRSASLLGVGLLALHSGSGCRKT